jgi:MoxR-like ATPase
MTADLLPADLIGVTVYDARSGEFRFRPGPIFTQLLLVDEINRGMPKTQSALLEAMEESHITVEGKVYPLPKPFLVIATQNPVEHIGTFPLPESQMDRFLLRIHLGYPDSEEEKYLLVNSLYREERETLEPVLSPETIEVAQEEIKKVRLHEDLAEYIRMIATKTREDREFLLGISPRGALALATSARARAWLKGRDYVIPEDISALLIPVCSHRIVVRGSEDPTLDRTALQIQALRKIVDATPLPL